MKIIKELFSSPEVIAALIGIAGTIIVAIAFNPSRITSEQIDTQELVKIIVAPYIPPTAIPHAISPDEESLEDQAFSLRLQTVDIQNQFAELDSINLQLDVINSKITDLEELLLDNNKVYNVNNKSIRAEYNVLKQEVFLLREETSESRIQFITNLLLVVPLGITLSIIAWRRTRNE